MGPGEVPAEEGALHGRGHRQRQHDPGRAEDEFADGDQLPRVAAEEKMEQCQAPAHQEHDGQAVQNLRLSAEGPPSTALRTLLQLVAGSIVRSTSNAAQQVVDLPFLQKWRNVQTSREAVGGRPGYCSASSDSK